MQITVPFNKKSLAKQLGAVFDRNTRTWNCENDITERLTDEVEIIGMEEKDERENTGTLRCSDNKIILPNVLSEKDEGPEWSNILQSGRSLEIALNIQKFGMPENEEIRIKILKTLSYRKSGEYPINYDGMLECSEDFRNRYPEEYVCELTQKCITGASYYEEEIRQSNITDEEKALLMFVLPFEH